MHYCCLIITKEFPTNDTISNILAPYNSQSLYDGLEEDESPKSHPVFTWDWYAIGGRYNGRLKLKIDLEDEKYRWQYYQNGGRNEKLFHSQLLSDMKKFSNNSFMFSEEHYYGSMGNRDDLLYVDGAYIDDLLNFEEVSCSCFIDKNGVSAATETWNGNEFIEDKDFEEKLRQCKQDSKGCYSLIVDIHD